MRLTAIVIFILFCLPVHAQQPTSAELEARRKSILESIRQTEEQLEATKNDKKATMGQLRALQSKLAERQRLISNINDEIERLNSNITTSTQEVAHLRENLATLKIRYAQSVRYAYRSRSSYDMLAFLFSSADFNEAVRRMKYLKKIRDYRKLQADGIRRTQGIIIKKIDVLNSEKSTKDNLLTDQEKQKLEIQKETNETNSVVNELKGREKQL
ncbi:MAG: murein hydrolase activator EnvC family protein, partial [Flavipsychrobacter sp.]